MHSPSLLIEAKGPQNRLSPPPSLFPPHPNPCVPRDLITQHATPIAGPTKSCDPDNLIHRVARSSTASSHPLLPKRRRQTLTILRLFWRTRKKNKGCSQGRAPQ